MIAWLDGRALALAYAPDPDAPAVPGRELVLAGVLGGRGRDDVGLRRHPSPRPAQDARRERAHGVGGCAADGAPGATMIGPAPDEGIRFVGANGIGRVRIGHGQERVFTELQTAPRLTVIVLLEPGTAPALGGGLRNQAAYASRDRPPTRRLQGWMR